MTGEAAHIVVVDDDPDVRETVAEYLRRNGFAVTEADGGAALREVMAARPIDLALLDINMPGEDGLTLAREIRGSGPAARTSIRHTEAPGRRSSSLRRRSRDATPARAASSRSASRTSPRITSSGTSLPASTMRCLRLSKSRPGVRSR